MATQKFVDAQSSQQQQMTLTRLQTEISNGLHQLRKAYEEDDDDKKTAAAMPRKRITPPLADNDLRWYLINKRQLASQSLSSETSPPQQQLSSAPQTSAVTSVMSPAPPPQQLSSTPQTSAVTSVMTSSPPPQQLSSAPSPPPPQLSPAPQTSPQPLSSAMFSPVSPPLSPQPSSSAMFSPVSPSYNQHESSSSSPVLLPCQPIPLLTIEQSRIMLEEAISNIVMHTTINTPLTVAQATHAMCTSMADSLLSEDLRSCIIIHDIASFNPWLL